MERSIISYYLQVKSTVPYVLHRTYTRLESKVQALYPRTASKIIFKHLLKPHIGGFQIANNSTKYAANLNAIADVKGLVFCGPDIGTGGLTGDIQSGWVAANAALGYTSSDLRINRNIVNDLRNV